MYQPQVIIAPTQEPLTLAQLKLQAEVDSDYYDAWFEGAMVLAREYVEYRTNRTLWKTTWEMVWDRFPSDYSCPLVLPRAYPLLSVTSVTYVDSSGNSTVWDPTQYQVNTDAAPGYIVPNYGVPWPVFVPRPAAAVRVRYIAGLDPNASPLTEPPQGLKACIAQLVASSFENREADVLPSRSGVQFIASKYGMEALLDQQKVSYPF